MSTGAMRSVDAGELRRATAVRSTVTHSAAPKVGKERRDGPSKWVAAHPRMRSRMRRDRIGRASNWDELVSGRFSKVLGAVEQTEPVYCCAPAVCGGEWAPRSASSPCGRAPWAVDRGLVSGRLVTGPVESGHAWWALRPGTTRWYGALEGFPGCCGRPLTVARFVDTARRARAATLRQRERSALRRVTWLAWLGCAG